METFEVKILVTGCHNCPYTTSTAWCDKAIGFETPEQFEQLNKENYFSITDTCPMSKAEQLKQFINKQAAKLIAKDRRVYGVKDSEALYDTFCKYPPVSRDSGQFCGGIESEVYHRDGYVYTFTMVESEITDCICERIINE